MKSQKYWNCNVQGSTNGVRRVRTYAYFYWRTHDFGHVYVDTYSNFCPIIFEGFQIFLVLMILYCLKLNAIYLTFNLFVCPWKRQIFLLFTFNLKKPYFSIFDTNYLINNFLTQSTCQFWVSVK